MGSCSFHLDGNHSSFHPGRNSIQLPPLHPAAATFHPGCITFGILLLPPFHPDVSHPEFFCAAIPPGCLASGILTSDVRGEHFNFPGHTYPDHLIVLTRRVLQIFCTVSRCSPEASRYLRSIFRDILL